MSEGVASRTSVPGRHRRGIAVFHARSPYPPRGVLALVDIDGTLLLGAPAAHTEALAQALAGVYGVAATAPDIAAIRPAGRTDQEIARLVLRAHGVDDDEISAGMARWMDAAAALHAALERVAAPPVTAPGADEALARMAGGGVSLALLTGNLEPIAHAKMEAAGLGGHFPRGRGAFGSDHERRDALVPIARRRHGEPAPVVVVGDTPRDIACARAGGAHCIAVTTGSYDAAELAAADAVVAGLAAAADVLDGWAEDGPRPTAATTES